jgi:hypothetical protein
MPWAIATEAGYIAADWFLARSPDPLSFALSSPRRRRAVRVRDNEQPDGR